MTELAADGNIAEIDDADGEEASRIGDYLASHGGPFFELQRRLGMLREDALLAGRRAALFVALAWGVPFLLSLVAGQRVRARRWARLSRRLRRLGALLHRDWAVHAV